MNHRGLLVLLLLATGAAVSVPVAGAAALHLATISRDHHSERRVRHHHSAPRHRRRVRRWHRVPSHPVLRSSEALVLDVTDSRVLYERNAEVPTPIASISKLMTTLVVANAHQPLEQRLQVTRADRTSERSRLPIGTRLTRAQLFHLALMSSENRAAHTLARNYPGGLAACIRAMNAEARALGMTHTHFVEPTGLSSHNISTPQDLAKLVMAAARNPIIRRYSTSRGYVIRSGRHLVSYHNTDLLVSRPSWHIIVQKTGFIHQAGMCLVMQTIIRHRTVVIVLLHSWGKYTRVADARRVKQWMEAQLAHRPLRQVATRA